MAAWASPFTFMTSLYISPLLFGAASSEIQPPGLQLVDKTEDVICENSPSQGWASEPWGNSGKKQRLAHSWGAYQRSDSCKPRLLHLPIETGVMEDLHKVNKVICKPFVPITFPLLQKLLYPSSLLVLRAFSWGYLRCCLPGLSPNFTPNKT